eukprot:COSAG04_NODE_7946_length_1043_cov_1.591102_2_plen_127_part_01
MYQRRCVQLALLQLALPGRSRNLTICGWAAPLHRGSAPPVDLATTQRGKMAALGPSVLAVTAAEALKARSARAALAVLRLEEPEPEPETPEAAALKPRLLQEADVADAEAAPGAAPGAAPELEPVAP